VGSSKLTELLLEKGADPNQAVAAGVPIITAARNGNLEIVKILLTLRYNHKQVMLMCCIREFSEESLLHHEFLPLDMFKEITKETKIVADPNRDHPETGESAMFHAISIYGNFKGLPDMVKILLEHGADPNRQNFRECPEYLVQSGMDFYWKSRWGFPLLWATELQNINIVRALLEKGADPNQLYIPNGTGRPYSVLSRAASHGDLDMVKLLLEYKADPKAADIVYVLENWCLYDDNIIELLESAASNQK
jgi:ankyrin repeat protein